MSTTKLTGAWGEALAAEHLRSKGYKIIAVGYRCRFGEIDLVARNRKYLAFVEVKLRKSAAYGQAGEFVDRRKQEKLRTTAELYLAEHGSELQPRFDVIEIYAPQGHATLDPKITHLEDAFQ